MQAIGAPTFTPFLGAWIDFKNQSFAVAMVYLLRAGGVTKMEYLLMKQKFLIERLGQWRSPEEIDIIEDLLTKIARHIASVNG